MNAIRKHLLHLGSPKNYYRFVVGIWVYIIALEIYLDLIKNDPHFFLGFTALGVFSMGWLRDQYLVHAPTMRSLLFFYEKNHPELCDWIPKVRN